ncbi:MAG: DUF6493 family protein [Propionibacteriaceae bacterium]|nr:DUF6493 family protein [Propionibacteriaceae bacterium]
MTDPTAELLALVQSEDWEQVAGQLSGLPEGRRSALAKALPKVLTQLRRTTIPATVIVAATTLQTTPRVLASTLDPNTVPQLLANRAATEHVTAQLLSRDRDWLARFIDAACARRTTVQHLPRLLDPLIDAHGLPLPSEPRYWLGWMQGGGLPRPGTGWQRRFLTACETFGAFRVSNFDPELRVGEIRDGITELRSGEPVDPSALLRGLLQVFGRGETSGAQNAALMWLNALDLAPQLWPEREAVVAALPKANTAFVKLALDHLLRPDLTDEELTTLAAQVLPRREKGPRRTVLKALSRITEPSEQLTRIVRSAAEADPTCSDLADRLLNTWETRNLPAPPVQGLWRDPDPLPPHPLPPSISLDDEALAELCARVGHDYPGDPLTHEQVLASLVATAHAGRLSNIREAISRRLGLTGFVVNVLENLLLRTSREITPAETSTTCGLLAHLLVRRAAEVIDALGAIPCLLSTPTHDDFHVSWSAFVERAGTYWDAHQTLLPADVAVALGRLDRSQEIDPDDLPLVRIQGVPATLAQVVATWLTSPGDPAQLILLPEDEQATRWANRVAARMRVTGEEATAHRPLQLHDAWLDGYRPGKVTEADQEAVAVFLPVTDPVIRSALGEIPPVLTLMPNRPARPAAWVLHALLERGADAAREPFALLARTAKPWGSVVSLLWLLLVNADEDTERDALVATLLQAWGRGAVSADDLVSAWHSRYRVVLDPSRTTVATTLIQVAQQGGLALVWPLLSHLVDELAGSRGFTGTTTPLLEDFQPLVPEVVAAGVAVELTEIHKLANHKGASPTVKAARLIVASLPQEQETW